MISSYIREQRYFPFLFALLLMSQASISNSLEIDLSAGGAVQYSSNSLRTDINQGSDTEQSAIMRFALLEQGQDVTANMSYSAEKSRFIQESYENRTVWQGNSALEWRVLPSRFTLLADHDIRDTVIDSRDPNTPDNRTKQQVVGVGTQFQANPSPVDSIFLLLRGASVHFDKLSGNDNQRKEATLSWQHLRTQSSSLNTGISVSDINYDVSILTDYQYQNLYIGADTQLFQGQLSFRIGVNKVKRSDLEDIDGDSYRLAWENASNTDPFQWGVYYLQELTDSSIGVIGNDIIPPQDDTGNNVAAVDILETQRLGLNFSQQLTSIQSQISLSLLWQDDEYKEQPSDEELRRIQLSLGHNFTRRLDGNIYLQYDEREYLNTGTSYDEDTVGFRCDYQLSRKLDLSFDIYHIKRDDSVTTRSFEDNVARLELMYTF